MKSAQGAGYRRALIACVMAMGLGVIAQGASILSVPTVWDESPQGPGTCVPVSGGGVAIAFGALPSPPPMVSQVASVVADFGRGDSPFVGNYLAGRVRGVRFLAGSDRRAPAGQSLFLRNALSGRTWYHTGVRFPASAAMVVTNSVSLDRTTGWYTDAAGNPTNMWVEDLASVSEIGVAVKQGGMVAQTYTIDDFVLVGDESVIGPAAVLAPVQRQALLERFGVLAFGNVGASQKSSDRDGDGMTDYREIFAGTDWKTDKDVFAARVADSSGSGISVQWRCVAGGVYNILWADDMGGGFRTISIDSVTDFTPTEEEAAAGLMSRVDKRQIPPGPQFYRIVKKE